MLHGIRVARYKDFTVVVYAFNNQSRTNFTRDLRNTKTAEERDKETLAASVAFLLAMNIIFEEIRSR